MSNRCLCSLLSSMFHDWLSVNGRLIAATSQGEKLFLCAEVAMYHMSKLGEESCKLLSINRISSRCPGAKNGNQKL